MKKDLEDDPYKGEEKSGDSRNVDKNSVSRVGGTGAGGGWSGWLWDVLLLDNEDVSSETEEEYYDLYPPGTCLFF